jgi:hypothetical protein
MLTRTFSTWARLLGLGHPAVVEEERRQWGRIPCDVETTCRPASGPSTGLLRARVVNVSRGGICLILGRRFDPDTLLGVALPGDESRSEVLACVVRCESAEGDSWELGCRFVATLSDQDLHLFGARHRRRLAPEQRVWERYPCQAAASYQIIRTPAPSASRPAGVLNISASGIALEVAEALDVGVLLSLELSRDGAVVLTTLASVVRTASAADGDRVAGCHFIRELDDEQLQALL